MLHAGRYSALGRTSDGGGRRPAARIAGARPRLAGMAPRHLPQPARLSVARMGGAVLGIRAAAVPDLLVIARLVHIGRRRPRPALSGHGAATDALRDAIVREINSNPDVHNMDMCASQARYRKWGYGFGPFAYGQEIYKDTAIYYRTSRPASRAGPAAEHARAWQPARARRAATWPHVTFFTGGTEAPDETAQGEWLNRVAKAGFSYLMASVKYLQNGEYDLQRIEEAGQQDAVSLTMLRVRPVRPSKTQTPSRVTPQRRGDARLRPCAPSREAGPSNRVDGSARL